MLRAILFDLDGTLANTDPIHFKTWRDLLTDYDLDIDRDFYDDHFSGRLNIDIIQDILPHLSPEEGKRLSDRKEAEFRRRAETELIPLAGLPEFLQWTLSEHLKRAIVTNAPPTNAHFMLNMLQLKDFFSTVVIGEELAFGKPHPLPYKTGLEQLQVSPQDALVFEDSPSGIQSAVDAGIVTVGVASTHSPDDLYRAGAEKVITTFTDPALSDFMTTIYPSFPSSDSAGH